MNPKVLVFAGSARSASLNKRLARAAAQAVRDAGGEPTLIDLDDYPIPLYNGDLEASGGIPDNAVKLKALFLEHPGFLIASPENNGSISALLKNTLDWMSGDSDLIAASAKILGEANLTYDSITRPKLDANDEDLKPAVILEKPFHVAELLDLVGLFCGLGTPMSPARAT